MKHLAWIALALAVAAILRPTVPARRPGGTLVVVADRSASLPAAERESQAALIESLERNRPEGAKLGVVAFGETAAPELAPQEGGFNGFHAAVAPDASDLDGALSLALRLCPDKTPARILVLSDGRATGRDPCEGAGLEAGRRGVAVDHRLQGAMKPDSFAVERIDAPLRLRAGETLLATAWVRSTEARRVRYALRHGGRDIATGALDLGAGLTPVPFRDLPRDDTLSDYEIRFEPDPAIPGDRTENDAARFLVSRQLEKPLLLIPASPESGLARLLRARGLAVRVAEPGEIDFSPAGLSGFSAVLIENRRADDLGSRALAGLAAWIREAGGGLALTGGRNAYGAGGYCKSPLEEVLPVSLELRREHRKFDMAVSVALDRSGSMSAPAGGIGLRTKMDMADLATAGILDLLGEEDLVSVFAVDTEPHRVLPLISAKAAKQWRDDILKIKSLGGGIYVDAALKAILGDLASADAPIRHAILFADARDAEQPGDYKELLAKAVAAGMTVSVVGLGSPSDCDADLLREVATLGNGLCLFAENANEIPRLFAQDTMVFSRESVSDEPVAITYAPGIRQLFAPGTLPAAPPPLGGLNTAYLRPGATLAAFAPAEEEGEDAEIRPILAFRPAGAGRAIVFLGEADGELAGPFAKDPAAGAWYEGIVRYATGRAQDSAAGLLLRSRIDGGALHIDADLEPDSPCATLSTLPVKILRTDALGETHVERTTLERVAADRFSAVLPLRANDLVLPVLTIPGSASDEGTTLPLPPARLPYSPEFAPDGDTDGATRLAALSAATGGSRLADPSDAWREFSTAPTSIALAPLLYLLSALVLLLDIFCRRLGLGTASRKPRPVPASAPAPTEASAPAVTEPPAAPKHPTPKKTPTETSAPQPSRAAPSALAEARRRSSSRLHR